MSTNEYFWQGGRKIPIEQTENDITLHASDVEAARAAANQAGVSLEGMERVGPDLIRATVAGERDVSIARLRQSSNVVHHVYRTPRQPVNH